MPTKRAATLGKAARSTPRATFNSKGQILSAKVLDRSGRNQERFAMRIDTRAWTTMRTVRDHGNKASRRRQCQQSATA
jgi:hypothetical protein